MRRNKSEIPMRYYSTWEVLPTHPYTDLKMGILEDENSRYHRQTHFKRPWNKEVK